MKEKFKMNAIIKKNTEDSIAGIIKYSNDDKRIDMARKFLGIGENKLRIEIMENYITLLKSKKIKYNII
jgi:hypothetical protein